MLNNLFTLLGNPHNAGSLLYRITEILDDIEEVEVRSFMQALFRVLLVNNEDTIDTVAEMLKGEGINDFQIKKENIPLIGIVSYIEPITRLKIVKGNKV